MKMASKVVIFTGPEVLFEKQANVIQKLFWVFALGACVAVSVIQISGRFEYFLSVPIAVDSKLSADEEIFPDFSICFVNIIDSPLVSNILSSNSGYLKDNITIHDLWKIAAQDLEEIVKSCTILQTIPELSCGNFTVTASPSGPCLTKQRDNFEDQHHLGNGIYLLLNTTIPLNVVVHPSGTPPFGSLSAKTYVLKPKSKSTFSVSTEKFVFYNTSRSLCVNRLEQNQCFFKCIRELELKQQICKTPYMENLPLNNCEVTNLSTSVNISTTISQVSMEECGCKPVCVLYPYATEVNSDDATTSYTDIQIAMASSVSQVTTQLSVYGFDSLLAEMGGSFGLFVGVSCLSLIELVEKFTLLCYMSKKKIASK